MGEPGARRWQVPVGAWRDERCFILGGGASLIGFDAERLRGKGRVIAIKDAGLTMCPWADVLYWADKWWAAGKEGFEGRLARLGEHTGQWKVGRQPDVPPRDTHGHEILMLGHDTRSPLSTDPGRLAGKDSGANCINLAWLLGARPIVALGFDMAGGNWDGRARKAERNNRYQAVFIPGMERMARALAMRGAEVLLGTPSALTCWPTAGIDDILAGRVPAAA